MDVYDRPPHPRVPGLYPYHVRHRPAEREAGPDLSGPYRACPDSDPVKGRETEDVHAPQADFPDLPGP